MKIQLVRVTCKKKSNKNRPNQIPYLLVDVFAFFAQQSFACNCSINDEFNSIYCVWVPKNIIVGTWRVVAVIRLRPLFVDLIGLPVMRQLISSQRHPKAHPWWEAPVQFITDFLSTAWWVRAEVRNAFKIQVRQGHLCPSEKSLWWGCAGNGLTWDMCWQLSGPDFRNSRKFT